MNERVIIVSGGEVDPADFADISGRDWIIGVDGGVLALFRHGMKPHLAVGDFDTAGPETFRQLKEMDIPTEKLPVAKEMTDTQYAVETALRRSPNEIRILGGLGGARFDHALANLVLLEEIEAKGVRGEIRNRNNRVRLLIGPGGRTVKPREETRYVSLLALTDRVTGVTLEGFLYPLKDAVLFRGIPTGISNELISGEGRIRIASGKLLVIESRD